MKTVPYPVKYNISTFYQLTFFFFLLGYCFRKIHLLPKDQKCGWKSQLNSSKTDKKTGFQMTHAILREKERGRFS